MHLLVVTQSLWLITSSMMIRPFLVYLKAPFNLCKPVKQVHRKEQCWCKEPGNNVPYYKDGLQDDSTGKWKRSFNNMNGTPFWQMTDISAVLGIRLVIDLEPTSKNPTFLSDVQASTLWNLSEVYLGTSISCSKADLTFMRNCRQALCKLRKYQVDSDEVKICSPNTRLV